MANEFKLPDIGEGLVEGEITKWLVKEGDVVEADQPMVEVMTDKATVEIPSPWAGTILKLHAKEGEVVPVGDVIVTVGADGESAESAKGDASEKETTEEKKEAGKKEKPRNVEARNEPAEKKERAREERSSRGDGNGGRAQATPEGMAAIARDAGKVLASPAVRRRAREVGIDLSAVQGSGRLGRITKEDLDRALSGGEPQAAPTAPAKPSAPATLSRADLAASLMRPPITDIQEEERIPLRGLRRMISQAMVKSKQTVPHFTYVDEVDMTEIVALREGAKDEAERYGIRLSYLPFIIKAVIPALRRFPMVNASLDEEANEIVYKKYYNIGIAVATEDGLMVPVVKYADQRTVLETSAEIQRLAEACRNRTARPEDLKGGTFTITSTGNVGGLLATPIVNWPEVAILGVHKIKDKPWVVDGEIKIRKIGVLSLSLDHRVVDGSVGAEFLNAVIRLLEKPGRMMLNS